MKQEQQENLFLSDFDLENGKRWDNHKFSSEKVSFYYLSSSKTSHKKYSMRVSQCSEYLSFKFQNFNDTKKLKLKKASFCRVRLCPVCQWRRSMAWRGRLFKKLPSLIQDTNYNFLFLTLTVKNCEIFDLSKTLKDMNSAWNRLRLRKEFGVVRGFIRATEVTKSNLMAHPHFHVILAVNGSYFKSKNYLKQKDWQKLWKESCRLDYDPVVDVRKIKVKEGVMETRAIIETLKYTTKVSDLLEDKGWFLCLSDQLKNKRFLSTGGCFKSILKEDLSNSEMIDECSEEDFEEDVELFFNWDRGFNKYKKVR